jgi:hypothetical protein
MKPEQETENSYNCLGCTVFLASSLTCLESFKDKVKKTHTNIMQVLAHSAKIAVYY